MQKGIIFTSELRMTSISSFQKMKIKNVFYLSNLKGKGSTYMSLNMFGKMAFIHKCIDDKESECICLLFPVKNCGAPPNVPGGVTTGTDFYQHAKISVRCNSGLYHYAGDLQRTCLPSGQWSGTTPVCHGKLLLKHLCSF